MTDFTLEQLDTVIQKPLNLHKKILAKIKCWHRNRMTRQHLKMLPDHLLDDIGLDRTSAKHEANKPFWK
ncbi:DUF1127 domain-containing protein [Vibrio sp. HN007]|uniref:DUF1127 domain-containing protein n=1 Tax=Vibrio iocasae TaxID=3098914 RepID=UPI0035D4BA78